MLNVLRNELSRLGFFDTPKNRAINLVTESIPISTVPDRMKLAFALSHLSHFTCQFRRNLELWDGMPVPINNITFVLADSGASKDRSHNAARACFKAGYDLIEEELENLLVDLAMIAAKEAGEELPDEESIYLPYKLPVPPIFMAISTGPGLVQHINDIAKLPITAGSIFANELGDELASNPSIDENLKILSEVYDLGKKEVTYTKHAEFRSDAIDGQPVSALMVGSPQHILYNEAVSKRFKLAFMSKLARRSWFCYSPEKIEEISFLDHEDPIKALIEHSRKETNEAEKTLRQINQIAEEAADYHLDRVGQPITLADEVFDLFNLYKRYNQELISDLKKEDTIYALVRSHLQWKALKLSGALAAIDCKDQVSADHFIVAAQYCELFDEDIELFEKELEKAPHERLSDFLQKAAESTEDGEARINLHNIKKQEYSVSVTDTKVRELASLCSGYDLNGIYTYDKTAGEIVYEAIEKPDTIGVSYVAADTGSIVAAVENNEDETKITKIKARVGQKANTGYSFSEVAFADIAELLQGNFAFSPFKFKDGIRGKDNIIGGTKFLVLDIDSTTMSDEDAHFLLDGINHHIARTSDQNNPYKYRVILELDSVVKLSAPAWIYFYTHITDYLGLQVDVLPQSQIFYAYGHDKVLSCTDGTPIETRDHVIYARERELSKEPSRPTKLNNKQREAALDDPLTTFWYAFESQKGRRGVSYYKAAVHALDLGADKEYVSDLLDNINDYTSNPLDTDRFERLKQQIQKM